MSKLIINERIKAEEKKKFKPILIGLIGIAALIATWLTFAFFVNVPAYAWWVARTVFLLVIAILLLVLYRTYYR